MILELKTYSNSELAAWFGIQSNSFRSAKPKKLKLLSQYCEYIEETNGKITITKIFDEEKVEFNKINIVDYVNSNFEKYWRFDELDTPTRVGEELYLNRPIELKDKKEDTFVKYARLYKSQHYGDNEQDGDIGYSNSYWSKILQTDNVKKVFRKYSKITEEEYSYMAEELQKRNENISKAILTMLQSVYEENEAPQDTVDKVLKVLKTDKTTYLKFIREISDELGCHWITKANVITKGKRPKKIKEETEFNF